MNTALLRIGLIIAFILPAGCAPAAAPTSIVLPSSTPLPPILTLTPSDTPIPTATLVVALEQITGIWTREDFERGTLFLVINEDLTYIAAHGSPQGVMHSGTFSMRAGVFTFVTGWDCSPLAGDIEGQYSLRLIRAGKSLYFYPIDDLCPDRPSALKGFSWNRVEGTPAP